MKKTIIGIDLGTTNCTMAYCINYADAKEIEQFKISQVIKANVQDDQYLLPSFIYFPLPEEIDAKMAAIEWDLSANQSVGLFARERGLELPQRVISSAKSWLVFSGVDRRNPFLPLHSEDKTILLSPLEACASILKHLSAAWDYKMVESPFNEAEILITVPASFDPSARALVQEAAKLAGYPEIILLEEPQAAFYAWLHKKQNNWRNILKVDDSVLVVDIGGGTTDFSLISVENDEGDLSLKRLGCGDHLLLGGDNIDLSLAYFARIKLEEAGHIIDEKQLQSLTYVCRQAKEKLLSNEPPKSVDITILGKGSSLIGGSLKTKITLDEILSLVVDGFIPLVDMENQSSEHTSTGLSQIGLPFAEDPRISCQLAKFLSKQQNGEFLLPTAILFNGGTLKASALQARLVELLNNWAKKLNKEPIKVLEDPDFDYAVSLGAVFYGLSRKGEAIRIKSGTSRSYYIGVEDSGPAVPGIPKGLKAVCVVPFGMEEGSESLSLAQEFALSVGQPATFRFFSLSSQVLSNGESPIVGTVVKNLSKELVELDAIETFLEKNESDGKLVRVKLNAKVTELGFLELWCVSNDERKWKLEFNVRS